MGTPNKSDNLFQNQGVGTSPDFSANSKGKSDAGQFSRDFVLLGGKDKALVIVQPGAVSVVNAIKNDPFPVGYSGIGYRTNSVKPLRRELTKRLLTF